MSALIVFIARKSLLQDTAGSINVPVCLQTNNACTDDAICMTIGGARVRSSGVQGKKSCAAKAPLKTEKNRSLQMERTHHFGIRLVIFRRPPIYDRMNGISFDVRFLWSSTIACSRRSKEKSSQTLRDFAFLASELQYFSESWSKTSINFMQICVMILRQKRFLSSGNDSVLRVTTGISANFRPIRSRKVSEFIVLLFKMQRSQISQRQPRKKI